MTPGRGIRIPKPGHKGVSPIGTLYVIATPIGNLEDLSPRALRILGEVRAILAEDTRVTRKLLTRHGLATPLISCHEHSRPERLAALAARLDSEDLALVSDAGTPGVSDPGAQLVALAHAAGHPVVAVPGPSAVTAALSISGLPADRYHFVGFLPRRKSERRALLSEIAAAPHSLVAFETPQRLRAALADLSEILGADRVLLVARELSKLHEESWRGSLGEANDRWTEHEPRGEFTLVIAGAAEVAVEPWEDARLRLALEEMAKAGVGRKDASRRLAAEAGRPAREIYALWPDPPDLA
jgi:16S rRNA (cytidine1402-2'-O)-methyltransferase